MVYCWYTGTSSPRFDSTEKSEFLKAISLLSSGAWVVYDEAIFYIVVVYDVWRYILYCRGFKFVFFFLTQKVINKK